MEPSKVWAIVGITIGAMAFAIALIFILLKLVRRTPRKTTPIADPTEAYYRIAKIIESRSDLAFNLPIRKNDASDVVTTIAMRVIGVDSKGVLVEPIDQMLAADLIMEGFFIPNTLSIETAELQLHDYGIN